MPRIQTYLIDDKIWNVIWVPPSNSNLDGGLGICYIDDHTIFIANNLSPEEETEVLIEELLHAKLWVVDHDTIKDSAHLLNRAFWNTIQGD